MASGPSHPVGRAVLRSSGGIVRLVMAKSPWALAFRGALTTLVNSLPPARTRAIGQITGIGYRYAAPRGSHRLVGTRVPDVRLTTGRLYESLRDGRFVLITPRTAPPARDIDSPSRKGRLAVETWASDRRTTVLVRPDGYVAWAADGTEGADATTVEAALTAWLGADAAS
ncbi:hypothetical protein [Streptomyces europaeiscabiei]|uniref:aromatic-ring hydroxylase C-terminal domain-containing protein n=1 Tax=Streptomyces europaeiscabiei TaxID=146819 RepID=UPI00399069AC